MGLADVCTHPRVLEPLGLARLTHVGHLCAHGPCPFDLGPACEAVGPRYRDARNNGAQAVASSSMCRWSVPQHPPSTFNCG